MDGHDESRLETGTLALLSSVLLLQLAERRIESRIGAELGLSQSDVLALALLVRRQQQSIGEIASTLDLNPGSTSTLVNRLVRAGLVARVTNPNDARSVLIAATPRGTAVVRSVRDRYADAIRSAAEVVSEDGVVAAAEVVRLTAEHLDEQSWDTALAG